MIGTITAIEVIDMVREAPAMMVRQNLGELLDQIQYRGDSVVITKSGKRVAALIDIALFERLRALDEDHTRLRAELAQALSGAPLKEGNALISQAQGDIEAFGRMAALLTQIDRIPDRVDAWDPLAWDEHGLPQ
jgi:prevent-host-death family protein